MRIGVLEVGSNTVHVIVVDAHRGEHIWPAFSDKYTPRLADNSSIDGCFFFSSRRRHTRFSRDWSSDVCSSDLEVIDDQEFQDPELLARRSADHRQIDTVLAARVGAEDTELDAVSGPRSLLDRVLSPAR